MYDLPPQAALQQAKARPVSGEELEVMGKHAASLYGDGACKTLNEAVIETVKKAGLSPEQVQRVIEFTNQSAFHAAFQKEGSHRYVDFVGGPASPSEIMKDLNAGGGGTVFDRGDSDYRSSPSFSKTAAAFAVEDAPAFRPVEVAYENMFKVAEVPLPYHNPFGETEQARMKLADIRDSLVSQLSSREVELEEIVSDLYWQVKQAALNGVPLGHIVQAWAVANPRPGCVKLAFHHIGPRLIADDVIKSDEFGASLKKTASAVVNVEHPLVQTFAAMCGCLEKIASMRKTLEEVVDAHSRISHFEKRAAALTGGGVIPKAWGAAKNLAAQASPVAAEKATNLGAAFLGPQVGAALGGAVGTAVKYAPHAAAALGAKEIYDRGVKYGPGQIPLRYAKGHIPGTREYYAREIGLQQGAWPM